MTKLRKPSKPKTIYICTGPKGQITNKYIKDVENWEVTCQTLDGLKTAEPLTKDNA